MSSVRVCKPGFALGKPDRDGDHQYEIIGTLDLLGPERISLKSRVAIDSTLDRAAAGAVCARPETGLDCLRATRRIRSMSRPGRHMSRIAGKRMNPRSTSQPQASQGSSNSVFSSILPAGPQPRARRHQHNFRTCSQTSKQKSPPLNLAHSASWCVVALPSTAPSTGDRKISVISQARAMMPPTPIAHRSTSSRKLFRSRSRNGVFVAPYFNLKTVLKLIHGMNRAIDLSIADQNL